MIKSGKPSTAPIGTPVRSPMRLFARMVLVLWGVPKTLVFNFRYLPFRQAIRLPILVSHRVALFDLEGTVTLRCPARTGTVLLGFGGNGAFDFRRARSVWQITGDVIFEGPARLGHGFKISVGGCVTFGPDFVLSAESQIVCYDRIQFGRGCLVSFDVLILDSDFHSIIYDDRTGSGLHAPIVLGDRVWIGARSTVLKGVELADDVVVAAGAMVVRTERAHNVLLGGNPARVLRTGVRWEH